MSTTNDADTPRISLERHGHVLSIGLNRPKKLNAWDLKMSSQVSDALTQLEEDDDLRCAVIFAHGKVFTAGVDLSELIQHWATGSNAIEPPAGGVDPLDLFGRTRTKPVVAAVHGLCYTVGIELLLACDIRVAASDTRFGQVEILRGIYPVGGATLRFAREVGWGNAMRYLLTGDEFDAAEALRIGFVQEVVEPGAELERALAIAQRIAKAAPLGVRATRVSAKNALDRSFAEALAALVPDLVPIINSEHGREGLRSFVERRPADFG
jgi:enoyl-CoA hydratase/carnithine racemase